MFTIEQLAEIIEFKHIYKTPLCSDNNLTNSYSRHIEKEGYTKFCVRILRFAYGNVSGITAFIALGN